MTDQLDLNETGADKGNVDGEDFDVIHNSTKDPSSIPVRDQSSCV